MRKLSQLIVIGTALITASAASAQQVLNGARLYWSGSTSNLNQMTVANGYVVILNQGTFSLYDRTTLVLAGLGENEGVCNSGEAFTFANDVSGGALAANGIYYVYLDGNSTTTPDICTLVSTVAPNSEAYASLTYKYSATGGPYTTTDTTNVFIGSFLTDANKNVIPFMRNGTNVYLQASANIGSSVGSGSGIASYTWSPTTGTLPLSQNVGFYVPLSATSVILRVDTANSQTSERDFAILDPFGLGFVTDGSGSYTANPQYVFRMPAATSGLQQYGVIAAVNNSNAITLWADNLNFSATLFEIGYVEDIRAPAAR